jgi:phosphoribosylamine--glycine ligase
MMRLKSNLVDLCLGAVEGRLSRVSAEWDERASLGVVLAAGGYPFDYAKGDEIQGLPEKASADTKVFHAGTARSDGKIVTAGGRVLCVCALGESVLEAQRKAYEQVREIRWENMYYRTDIGYRAIGR